MNKQYIQGWSNGFKAGWDSSLELMKEQLKGYSEIEEGFSEYQSAMYDAIELADALSSKQNEKLDKS